MGFFNTSAGNSKRGFKRNSLVSNVSSLAYKYAVAIAGQSNAVGTDTSLVGLPATWPSLDTASRLTKYDGTSAVPLVEPVNGTGGTFAISFADALIRNAAFSNANEIAIVPAPPVGGSTIAQWQKGGAYYLSLVTRLLAAKASGYTMLGIIWYQGENDAITLSNPTFISLTQAMFADLRADLMLPNFRGVIVRLHIKNPNAAVYLGWDARRDEQLTLADTNTIVVDTSAGPQIDSLHLSTLSQKALGEYIASKYITRWGSPPEPALVGVRGWTNSNRVESMPGRGTRLSATTGGFVGIVGHLNTTPTTNENLFSTISGNTGWGFPALSSGAQLRFRAGNATASTLVNSAIKILGPSDVGKTHAMLAYVDVAGLLIGFWFDGVAVGAPVVTTGFTPASASVAEQVGMQGAILPATSWTICNRIAGNIPPTLGEIAQWFVDVKASANGFATISGKTTQADMFGNGTAPNVPLVMDRVFGDGLSLVAGTVSGLTYHDVSGLAWGY